MEFAKLGWALAVILGGFALWALFIASHSGAPYALAAALVLVLATVAYVFALIGRTFGKH